MSLDTATRITMSAIEAAAKARVPVMLVGAPGTGKTAVIRELAKTIGYELITLIGSQLDPTDLNGLPKGEKIFDDEDGNPLYGTVFLSPHFQVRVMRKKKVIIFLDEFSNTAASTRAAMLTLLQNREFANGEKMPDETIVIGAMNAAEDAADGYELDMPTTNRMMFVHWDPSHNSWYEGMLRAWGQKVSDDEMKWRRKIVSFIRDNPTWLHKQPIEVESATIYGVSATNTNEMEVFRSAWASRRSWEKLAQILAFAPDDNSVRDMIANGMIGYPAASAFRDWLRKNDVISPQAVIDDPKAFDFKSMNLDESNMVFREITKMIDEANSGKVIAVFDEVAEQGRQDAGGPFMREVITKVCSNKFASDVQKENKRAIAMVAAKYRDAVNASRR